MLNALLQVFAVLFAACLLLTAAGQPGEEPSSAAPRRGKDGPCQ